MDTRPALQLMSKGSLPREITTQFQVGFEHTWPSHLLRRRQDYTFSPRGRLLNSCCSGRLYCSKVSMSSAAISDAVAPPLARSTAVTQCPDCSSNGKSFHQHHAPWPPPWTSTKCCLFTSIAVSSPSLVLR